MKMLVALTGLLLGNARRILSIWLVVQIHLVHVEKVVEYVDILFGVEHIAGSFSKMYFDR